jgi:hypothetical protein
VACTIQLKLDRAQQADFGSGGQFSKGHGRVAGIQIKGGCSRGPPLQSAFFALLAPGPLLSIADHQHALASRVSDL